MSSENLVTSESGRRCSARKIAFGGRRSRSFFIILISVITSIYVPLSALAKSEPDRVKSLDGLVKHVYRDTKHVLTAPLRWKQNDLVLFATLSTTTLALMATDKDIQESVQKNKTHTTDRISKWTDRYTKRVTNLTIGGLYLSGLILHDRKSKETALLCLESVALAEGITKGLKPLIGRSRPFGNKGAFNFDPLKFPPLPYSLSFPSGHATTAFALSSVIAEQYRSWYIRLISYSFASAVSLGRVNNNVHFLSDVFWGGVIGISVGRCLVSFHKKDYAHDCKIISVDESGNLRVGISVRFK